PSSKVIAWNCVPTAMLLVLTVWRAFCGKIRVSLATGAWFSCQLAAVPHRSLAPRPDQCRMAGAMRSSRDSTRSRLESLRSFDPVRPLGNALGFRWCHRLRVMSGLLHEKRRTARTPDGRRRAIPGPVWVVPDHRARTPDGNEHHESVTTYGTSLAREVANKPFQCP